MHATAPPASGTQAARLSAAIVLLNAGDIDAAEQAAQVLSHDYPHGAGGFALFARCADARGDWELSLARWLDCAARFPADPAKWRIGLAYAFLNADRLDDAAHAFNTALETDPQNHSALAGQALVVSRVAPAEADALWRALFDRVGNTPKANWQVNRARALAACGQNAQALTVLDQALADTPAYRPAMVLRANLLDAAANRAGGLNAQPSVNTLVETANEHLDRLRQHRLAGDLSGARASLSAAMQAARTASAFTGIFQNLPYLFQSYERGQRWRALRSRVTGVLPQDAHETICLQMRLDIALRDFDAFLDRWAQSPHQPEPWGGRFNRLATLLQASVFPDLSAPKIFGIGLSKSGTTSLAQALERLGHLHAHFRNPFTFDLLQETDFVLFDSASDSPVSARFETLYILFPNAKFILTDRPIDSWANSLKRHFERWQGSADAPFREHSYASLKETLWGLDRTIPDGVLYRPYADEIAAYQAHHQRVERFFADKPAGKLLRHNVFRGDGWAELCAFLDRPVPQEPYPWTNQAPSS